MKSKIQRFTATLLALLMSVSVLGVTAFADEPAGEAYTADEVYVLNYNGEYEGAKWQYFSPYWPAYNFEGAADYTQSIAFTLYDTANGKPFVAYCTDLDTGLDADSNYRRLNLEDSTYAAGGATLLRSIMLNSFPNVSAEELGAAAGVEGLTVGEAVAATQAAIWQAAHGSSVEFTDFCDTIDTDWSPTGTVNYDACNAEIASGYAVAENEETIEAHIEAVFNYLVNLEPTAPTGMVVSGASFTDWSDAPAVTKEEDGTYTVSVTATVNVEMAEGDALTLTAVLGSKSVSEALANGENTKTLTFTGLTMDEAHQAVTLAIDGTQTVTDVFLFDAEGERSASQSLIGIYDQKLPAHAEIVVQPERKVIIEKFEKVLDVNGKASKGEPLEGIRFAIYEVCTLEEYLSGDVRLSSKPTEKEIDTYQVKDGQVGSVVTDAEGKAVFNLTLNNLPDGVYMIVEEAHPAIELPVDPFFVMLPTSVDGDGWDYEIIVQPKNIVKSEIEINKDVIKLDNDESSVNAGEDHTWIIRASVPKDIATAQSYVISDTLDYRLDFADGAKVFAYNSVKGEVALEAVTDYVLATSEATDANGNAVDAFTVSLTESGMKKAAEVVAMDAEIRVYFNAKTNANATVAEEIPNVANVVYKNSFGYEYDAESDKPVVYTGAAQLLKVDGKTRSEAADEYGKYTYEKMLPGATFKLARAAAEGETAQDTLKIGDAAIPVVYVDFYTSADFTGEQVFEVTSDENGAAGFYGLAYGTYYLVETVAPAGYNMLHEPAEVTIAEGSHLDVNKIAVENYSGFDLPETGGIGTTIYTVMGSLLICAAGAYIFLNKKRLVA